jgi:hypothetical protein
VPDTFTAPVVHFDLRVPDQISLTDSGRGIRFHIIDVVDSIRLEGSIKKILYTLIARILH